MSRAPVVSVIVVSYQRADDLRLCLEALVASDYPALELIVVDNASSDAAPEVAAGFPGVRLVRNAENVGFAAAVNQGYALASGEYVALVNNDAVVAPDWLQRMASFLQRRPEAAAVGGKVYFWDDANPLGEPGNHFWAYSTVDPRSGFSQAHLDAPEAEREVATLSGALVMIRRSLIEDVGLPFLEPLFFTYYEETDFFARALRRGHRLFYLAEPVAWHRLRASSQPYRYFLYMERNRLLFAYRNFPDDVLRACLAATARSALEQLGRHPLRLLAGGDDELRARRDAWRWALRSRAELSRQREAVAHVGSRYDDAVAAIEARVSYYAHARPEVAALVPAACRQVIDVGCATGALGAALRRERPGVAVRGIEPVSEQAQIARAVLEDVLCAGADAPLPPGWPRPDCVIFADVLEHLVDPWRTLALWRDRLTPDGWLVLSVPNVGHRSVARGLLSGAWRYAPAGILDRTHLRFFTRSSAIELVEQAGFRVEQLLRVDERRRVSVSAQRIERALGPRWCPGVVSFAADADTVQFLIVAKRGA